MKKKYLTIILIIIIVTNVVLPVFSATYIDKANLIYDHAINTHIMFENAGSWHTIKGGFICYKIDNKKYPAYCISHGIHGVDEEGDYTVTINDLLKDKLIYNTILNGYPYNTPEQLGVDSIDDAYIATKQAIYSVLLDRDVTNFYKAEDEEGQRIINAILNISEKGKAGNKINEDAKLNINKVSEIKEIDDYYYQEYKLTANVSIKDYTVQSIEGFCDNAYIADINGNEKKTFNANENFKLMIPKDSFKNDIEGKILITSSCKTNAIFYGEAPKNDVQNYAITYDPYANYELESSVKINTNTAKIKIIKKDKDTLDPIKDVTFGLFNEEKTLLEKKNTNEKGEVLFENLYQGQYFIQELQTDENYIADTNMYEIFAKYNETYEKEITNEHKKGNLKILKVDKDNNKITLGGIEFDLIDENGKIVNHLTTNADGEAFVENLNTGKYTIKETNTKKEYMLCENEEIEIKWNETTENKIENEKKKGKIEIYKTDSENENIKLKGVEFQITDLDGKIIEKLTTDSNGHAISKKIEIGKYYLQEIKTDSKYVLNGEKIMVNIETNKTLKLELQNKKIKGKIKIIKSTGDDSIILNLRKGDKLPNVEFEIYDSNKNLVDTIITKEDGEAISKELEMGKYIIKEKNREKGFLINLTQYFASISKDNEIVLVDVENTPIVPRVEIEKKGVDFAQKNEEIKYDFDIKNKSNAKLDSFTWVDYLPYSNSCITKLITGTYSEDVDYNLFYKTNKNEYKLLKEINSFTNEYIDFSSLELEKNEKIIEVKIEYGKVSSNFSSIETPQIFVKVANNVKKDDEIINNTKIIGIVDDYIVSDESSYNTIIKEKEITKKLPKTGG